MPHTVPARSQPCRSFIRPFSRSTFFLLLVMSHIVHGWVSQPDGRGTFDIVWSSLLTVFLCTWTVLCLNLPAKTDSYSRRMFRKFRWMLLAIIGPEFVLSFAIGQWASAKRSQKQFDMPEWTMRHAFFADMGGFVLQPRESAPFSINAKQLYWLVTNGYMPIPAVEDSDISDKSKADGFAKIFTISQVSWFLIETLGRAVQKLEITTLELSSIAIVACTLATFFCWLNKPLDVAVPIVIPISASSSEIILRAGEAAAKPYLQTPLDFIDNQGPSWSTDVMLKINFRTGPSVRPLDRLGNDRIPHLPSSATAILFFLTLLYSSMHIIGWNFSFATVTEKILWQVCSVTILVTTVMFWAVDRFEAWRRHGLWGFWMRRLVRRKGEEVLPPSRAEYKVSWIEFAINLILMISYTLSRIYLMVEVFVGLRALPESTFQSVDWANLIPHL